MSHNMIDVPMAGQGAGSGRERDRELEQILGEKFAWEIKARFGSKWKKAWIGWRPKDGGTFRVSRVDFLKPGAIPAHSSGVLFLTRQQPTDRMITEAMILRGWLQRGAHSLLKIDVDDKGKVGKIEITNHRG